MKSLRAEASIIILIIFFTTQYLEAEAQVCKPSGKIIGRKPPPDACNLLNSNCCLEGKAYKAYRCSPKVSHHTKAVLTLGSFEEDGGDPVPLTCDGKFYMDEMPVVALSTGWYKKGGRCHKNITITANRNSVTALVVDECDSTMGCDEDHDFQPPCGNNIVVASRVVWEALDVPPEDWDTLDVTWSDV